MEDMSALLLPLSASLQSPSTDLSKCIAMVMEIRTVLKQRRQNAETLFAASFLKVSSLATEIGVEMTLPRRVGRQTHRDSYLIASTPEDYYRYFERYRYYSDLLKLYVLINCTF
jgi:hypothetical protein